MKRTLLLLCTLILIPSHVMGQGQGIGTGGGDPVVSPDPQTWKRYTVKGEEFSVILPMLPAMVTVETPEMRLQEQRRRQRQLITSHDGILYEIDIFENSEPRQSLKDFIAAQTANSVYDLTTERDLTVNGFAGKEYSSRTKPSPTTVQFFATENRLFRFSAGGAVPKEPGIKQFFSSIRLGKEQEGIEVYEGQGHPFYYSGERTYTGREVDVKPRLLAKPEPQYTAKARLDRISGTVVLKVVFSATGDVTNVRVVSGLPDGLTERAIAAARMIKFTPAIKDGKPVSMWMQLEYNFFPY